MNPTGFVQLSWTRRQKHCVNAFVVAAVDVFIVVAIVCALVLFCCARKEHANFCRANCFRWRVDGNRKRFFYFSGQPCQLPNAFPYAEKIANFYSFFHCPSVLWHCWLGCVACKIVPKMAVYVSCVTLNPICLFLHGCNCHNIRLKDRRPPLICFCRCRGRVDVGDM